MTGPFRRLNFFKGLFTQAEDWQAEQAYHMNRLRLHHRSLHTSGLVKGFLEELDVRVDSDDNLLQIAPGAAVDGHGRELYLPEPVTLKVIPADFQLPETVYVVIRYDEQAADRRDNVVHSGYSGYAFTEETVKLEVRREEPDPTEAVEIARITLWGDGIVRRPDDPMSPGPNEIDRTRVRWAGGRLAFSRPDPASFGMGIGEWRGGSTNATPSRSMEPSEDEDTHIDIEEVRTGDPHRLYLASVYPKADDATITWFIRTRHTDEGVEYRLIIKNFGENTVQVDYRVYRLA